MAINSKNTKAEILAAYKNLEKEKKALEAEKKAIKASTDNHGLSNNSSKTILSNSTSARQIEQRDIAKTLQILEQLQIGFGGAVSSLSEQLITEATTLEDIRELITDEQQQLKELHELETIEDDTIDRLIEQYQDNYKQFSEAYESESENKHKEIARLVTEWNKEQEIHQRQIKIRNEVRKKELQRTTEEYQYNLDLTRDLDEEVYEQEKQAKYRELETIRQELEQQWEDRETTISLKEKEYTTAKEQVAQFEEKLRKKIEQGEQEGKGIGIYQAKVKHNLRAKEIAGEQQNYQLRIEALKQTIDSQEARIAKLSQQLDLAQQQVQGWAVKAIGGRANRQSYEAMKEIAMEQAKTQQKGK